MNRRCCNITTVGFCGFWSSSPDVAAALIGGPTESRPDTAGSRTAGDRWSMTRWHMTSWQKLTIPWLY